MRRLITHFLLLLLLVLAEQADATVVVINTGVAGTPEYNVGPVYMSPTLFYRASRWSYLYTQSELTAAGITTGSVITDLGWMKNNSASSLIAGKFRIYMKNSSTANYSNATETWTNLNAGTTMVYENLNQLIPATANPAYINFTLNTSFTYTGGSIEIGVEWDATASTGTLATGSFDWMWSTVTDRIYGNGGSTLSNSLSSTSNNVNMDNRRPFIQITFNSGTPSVPACVTTPTAPVNAGSVCAGPVTLSWPAVTGATGYSVYLDTGTTSTTVVSANQTGTTYAATVAAGRYAWKVVPINATGPATGCSTFTFTVNAAVAPSVSIVATPAGTICAGTPVTFTATPVNGGTTPAYQWKKRSASVGTNSVTYTDNALVTGDTISVVLTSNAACASPTTATSNFIVPNVVPRPTATITPAGTASICSGDSVRLNANTGTGFTYQWQQGNTDIPGASASGYSVLGAGTYRVVVSNGVCADTSANTAVTVVTRPVATISPSAATAICQGGTVTFSGPSPVPGITYQWQRNGVDIAGATSDTYTAINQGTYRLVLSNGNCSDTSAAVPLTVNPLPAATATASGPTAFCSGGSVVLSANTGAGITYRWLRNNFAIVPAATAATYTATTTGTYSVIVTNTATGCFDTSRPPITVTVSVIPSNILSFVGSLTFCQGSNVRLQAATGTGFTYVWYKDAGIIPGATASSYTATAAGVYYCVITNGACVTTTQTRTVVVNPLPTATATAGGPTSFCAGGSVILNANTGTGLTYQWQYNTGNIPGATSSSYTATNSGVYTVVVSNGVCTNTSNGITVLASVAPVPVITASGSPVFCQGNSVTLGTTAAPGYTYQWRLGGTPIPGATASAFSATATGSYTVTVTNGACVSTSQPFAVSVTPAPPATITAAGPTSFCQGGNVLLNANRGTGFTYQWARNTINIPGATDWQYTANTSGNYTVSIFDGNCPATSGMVSVTVNAFPVAVITVTGGTDMSTGVFATYQWYRNGVLIPGATGQNYTAVQDGYYSVVVTDAAGCSATSPVQRITALDVTQVGGRMALTVWPNPVTDILHIQADRAIDIRISSVDGKLLLSAERTKQVDMSRLPQGVYLVRIQDAGTGALISVQKVIRK